MAELHVGTTLYGYCAGVFGHNLEDKIIVAVTPYWIVAKSTRGEHFYFAQGNSLALLANHTQPEDDDED